jgi:predicted GTPase
LKVGAARYRELLANHDSPETAKDPLTLTLALCGAVKAGKSSLINALLGEDRAGVDVIPLTAEVTSYEMKVGDLPALLLLDTPGYGEAGPSSQELAAAFDAAKRADLLVLVTPARTAARKADVEFLAKLTAAFEAMPALKLPPVVIALSHADLLTPAAEWAPPYDWKKGIRPKETTMRDAVLAAQEQLGTIPTVPIVTLPEKLFNVHEGLLPTLASEVPQARGAAILRLFARDGSAGAGKKALEQALNIGREALKAVWQSVKAK